MCMLVAMSSHGEFRVLIYNNLLSLVPRLLSQRCCTKHVLGEVRSAAHLKLLCSQLEGAARLAASDRATVSHSILIIKK